MIKTQILIFILFWTRPHWPVMQHASGITWMEKNMKRQYKMNTLIERIDYLISTMLGRIYKTMSRNQAQDEKTLYRFLRSLWPLVPKFSFWKWEWVLGSISTYLWDFFNICQYSKIRSLNSFSKLWGNSFRMFFVLDIMYHFTCRESNLYKNLEMFLLYP